MHLTKVISYFILNKLKLHFLQGESNPPDANLVLEYIHGYRCHDARNNLKYGPNGEVVYHTAAVGIVLDPKTNKQRFFMEHTDDILCLDVFKQYVVTGQIGHKPLICLWDMNTMESLFILKGVLEKGINNVCFSHDGKFIAASSIDEEHTMLVCDREITASASSNPSNQKGAPTGIKKNNI
jgi:WD40 repeat protein